MRQSFIRKPVKAEIHRLQGSTTITLTGKAGDYVVTGRSPQILTPGRFRKEFMPARPLRKTRVSVRKTLGISPIQCRNCMKIFRKKYRNNCYCGHKCAYVGKQANEKQWRELQKQKLGGRT